MATKPAIDLDKDPQIDLDHDNMRFWKAAQRTNPAAVKPITGRDYGGSSPNPTYIIARATQVLGPVGIGWGWHVQSEAFETFGTDVLHWCRIRVWIGEPARSFDSYGQTKAAYIAKRGTPSEYMKLDEDAPKKSLTDAIIKALAQLGFAHDIFLGRWDDQKYVATLQEEFGTADEPLTASPPPSRNGSASTPPSRSRGSF